MWWKANVKRKIVSLLFFSPPFLMPLWCAFQADMLQKCRADLWLHDMGVLLRHRGCQGPHGCGSPVRGVNPPVLFNFCDATDLLPAFTGWRNIKIWDQFKHLFESIEQKWNVFLNPYCSSSECPYDKRKITKFHGISMCMKNPPCHIFNISYMPLIPLFSLPSWWPSDKVKLPQNRWDYIH